MYAVIVCLALGAGQSITTDQSIAGVTANLILGAVRREGTTPNFSNFQLYINGKPSDKYLEAGLRVGGFITDLYTDGNLEWTYDLNGLHRYTWLENDRVQLITTLRRKKVNIKITITAIESNGQTTITGTATFSSRHRCFIVKRIIRRELEAALVEIRKAGIQLHQGGQTDLLTITDRMIEKIKFSRRLLR